jgi:phosphoglycerol transferase
VIVGDHLPGLTPVSEKLAHLPERGVYNRFLNPDRVQLARTRITHFDLLPTILEHMGFRIEGGKLGMGLSGIGPVADDNDPRAKGIDWTKEMGTTLLDRSSILNQLWTTP